LRKGDNERLYPQVIPDGIVYKNPQDIKQWTSDTVDIKKSDQDYFSMNDFKIKLGQSEIKELEFGIGETFEIGGVKVELDGDE
jgi:hypothetical protein